MTDGNGMNGGASFTPEQLQEFAARQHAQLVAWIAQVASCTPEVAHKCLMVSAAQVQNLQQFLLALVDEKATAEHPILGIRLWKAGSKEPNLYLSPKYMPKLIGGGWVGDHDSDIICYMATMAMLTSVEGRAIMMAQGYRIEFLQAKRSAVGVKQADG